MATNAQISSWEMLTNKLGERQILVFNEIRKEPRGLTLFELTKRLGLPVNQISGRVTELNAKGFIQSSGEKRINPETRKSATVWKVRKHYEIHR